jgi:alpha,alpha-trehalose phosphorylase
MIHRERIKRPAYVYPRDEWRMVEKRFYPELLAQTETFFATANGYLGMRGSFDEGRPVFDPGTFVNGFYESWQITYAEMAYGFAKTGQTIVGVPDGKIIRLHVDDEPFYLPTANLLSFERILDMRNGTLTRDVLWETPSGKQVSIRSTRVVSFNHRHVAAISFEVTVLNADAPVVVSSQMVNHETEADAKGDPRRARGFQYKVLLPEVLEARDRRVILGFKTANSHMTLAASMDHNVVTDCPWSCDSEACEDTSKVVFSFDAKQGKPIRITKYLAYHTSRSAPARELCDRAERALDRVRDHGFEDLLRGQREFLDDFWRRSDVVFEGDPAVQQALRFNLFHILQATGRAEGVGVPAKGMTGRGYEGHYFWDTEIYLLPFLIYTAPRIAKNLLRFRHGYLDKARERAREINQKGALFPWRTINGEEASAYYAAGTAQYHINADIIYALKKYVDVSGDTEFLYNEGAEMLVESARLWADLGFYSRRKGGKFCIHGVTGPDEYNTVVNNNTFTNLMARENLWYAAETVDELRRNQLDRFKALADRTRLDPAEIEDWRRAADNMYLPFDEEHRIHPQDDEFLDKEVWDLENTPEDHFPLLLHYHPLVIYRHAVIKQADVVLASFLLGHEFTLDEKRRNFEFYDPLTTGDSSLSSSIQAIVAAQLGLPDQAMQYARYAVLMDLGDVSGNVKDGCHIASMGGTWMAVVYGLAGLSDWDGKITFKPRKPLRFERVRFPLTIRGQSLEVDIATGSVTYTLTAGDALTIHHESEEIRLTRAEPVAVRPQAAARKTR